jgi:hypothetical protein
MALQATAIARQWLNSDHVGTQKDMKATMAHQPRNGVFSAVHAELL